MGGDKALHIKHIREAHFRSGVVCPRCQSKSTICHGKADDRQRYLCKSCRHTFTDFTGTPLAYVKKPADMWDEVARRMRDGYSCQTNLGLLCPRRSNGDTRCWLHFALERT